MKNKKLSDDAFSKLGSKLERNVYGSIKGKIRLALLKLDIEEYCKGITTGSSEILDIGGGAGHFATYAAEHGCKVLLIDKSKFMLEEAAGRIESEKSSGVIELQESDFLAEDFTQKEFDLVVMHGSAEWMEKTETAIAKAAQFVRPGGHLSLLVYNIDRHLFKRGVSGQLLISERTTKGSRLTPPGALTAQEVEKCLHQLDGGRILHKSGIRIFQGFFRTIPEDILSFDEWLNQEVRYYRKEPFASMGEHTHFIWQRT